jgi:hypothetical protein
MGRYGRKLYSIFIILILAGFVFAQIPDLGQRAIQVFIQNGQLKALCHFNNLASSEMNENLTSGMSQTILFHFELRKENDKKITSKNPEVKLRYDVWEGTYMILIEGKQKDFKIKDRFYTFLNDSLAFKIDELNKIPSDESLQVFMDFSEEKISGSQKRKLDYWLTGQNESQNINPDNEKPAGFSINLSSLISMFVNKKNEKSTLVSSKKFTKNSLLNQ